MFKEKTNFVRFEKSIYFRRALRQICCNLMIKQNLRSEDVRLAKTVGVRHYREQLEKRQI